MPSRKWSGPRALVVAVTVLAPLVVVAPAAQAAPTESVVTLMSSNVRVHGSDARPVGAILTIINTCPDGSVLDRAFLQTLEPDWATSTPHGRRASRSSAGSGGRAAWSRGGKSGLRSTARSARPSPAVNGSARELWSTSTPISINWRLWGPVTHPASLLVDSGFAVWRGEDGARCAAASRQQEDPRRQGHHRGVRPRRLLRQRDGHSLLSSRPLRRVQLQHSGPDSWPELH